MSSSRSSCCLDFFVFALDGCKEAVALFMSLVPMTGAGRLINIGAVCRTGQVRNVGPSTFLKSALVSSFVGDLLSQRYVRKSVVLNCDKNNRKIIVCSHL